MKGKKILMVRIYLHETDTNADKIIHYLHDKTGVAGVTVYRGISGFGVDGKIHTSALLDISLDLPVVIEFYDDSEKLQTVLEYLKNIVKPGHMVCWPAMSTH
jgi:uncharacterized protein